MNKKELFLNEDLKTGGFYELSIQGCPSADNKPIELYTDWIWNLPNVDGPFDLEFNPVIPDITNFQHKGILNLGNFSIPFLTYNIRETEPIETGFNWFDICFYTAAIEKVFGSEFQTWVEHPHLPNQINDFFKTAIRGLFEIYRFQLAIIDFEVSGQYYLEDLKRELTGEYQPSKFFVGIEKYNQIAAANKRLVTIVETLAH